MAEEVFSWLKSLPSAPEYYPTIVEFRDPISYIFKIEQEASRYGICKILPPVPNSPKETIIANLNRCLSSQTPDSSPTFTTRKQQIGFSPRKNQRPAQRSVWESGVTYTLSQFKQKAKQFKQKRLNSNKELTPLEIETMYWKAQAGRPFSVEYANDMPGSAFDEAGAGQKLDYMTVEVTQWNMRRAARANGSLLKFLKEEIPGVTSPMVYLGMLYSWFAWHVEDHDLHSLNYMHMGAAKTWYGIPMEAALAFEDVIRTHVYGGQISPTEAIATLARKTTILSPEVLIKAGVPCYRLLQNPRDFVVTFPRAYHSGFSHGYNCADAVNMATPGWLRVAREAAIRRACIDSPPLLCDSQLLYDLALSLSSSGPNRSTYGPQSSRLTERLNNDIDAFVKRTFMLDVMHNNKLLDALGNGSPITLLSKHMSYDQPYKKAGPASIFSCVACGSPCYSCIVIVQPTESAAHYLMLNEVVNVKDPGTSLSGMV
ncbi:lysine-specific demethylase REF6-like [Bidens hawaiensis]|uniref:lysine-specific demethylase REF6-like n=1 Tax=Bidens hawaiensis TaxID=980011 RepID=UPI0040495D31